MPSSYLITLNAVVNGEITERVPQVFGLEV